MPALQWAPVGLHLQEGLSDGYCCDVSSERADCWLHSHCMLVIFSAFGWTLAQCLPAGRCVSAGCFVCFQSKQQQSAALTLSLLLPYKV